MQEISKWLQIYREWPPGWEDGEWDGMGFFNACFKINLVFEPCKYVIFFIQGIHNCPQILFSLDSQNLFFFFGRAYLSLTLLFFSS